MSKSITAAETAKWLKERDNFLILTHRRPDGDTVGSAGALAQGLREVGKTAYVLRNPEITPRYAPFVEDYAAPDGFEQEHTLIVDTASYKLFPKDSDKYVGNISLSIDHHPSNTMYAELTCLDPTTASCGEIIYEILIELAGKISAKSAGCLYLAVSTDTGCFSFANTTANTLRVASLTVEAGAPHIKLNRKLFRTKSHARVKIEGMIYAGMEFHFGGKVAIASVSHEMMSLAQANDDDVDDIASLPGSIEGVQAGITISELSSTNDCKISVRSSPSVDANAIAARFGGGGHAMASGFSLGKPIQEVKEDLLEVLKDFF
ncbi:MAG: bifunctional oligoribonuclease/PAP phosphatase NrnA [Oscillospiraceae bacterium]|nr:bifunctional oligoribonuclease/PAP phosphatase NrnA [Oscillospiraceae bacterium]